MCAYIDIKYIQKYFVSYMWKVILHVKEFIISKHIFYSIILLNFYDLLSVLGDVTWQLNVLKV